MTYYFRVTLLVVHCGIIFASSSAFGNNDHDGVSSDQWSDAALKIRPQKVFERIEFLKRTVVKKSGRKITQRVVLVGSSRGVVGIPSMAVVNSIEWVFWPSWLKFMAVLSSVPLISDPLYGWTSLDPIANKLGSSAFRWGFSREISRANRNLESDAPPPYDSSSNNPSNPSNPSEKAQRPERPAVLNESTIANFRKGYIFNDNVKGVEVGRKYANRLKLSFITFKLLYIFLDSVVRRNVDLEQSSLKFIFPLGRISNQNQVLSYVDDIQNRLKNEGQEIVFVTRKNLFRSTKKKFIEELQFELDHDMMAHYLTLADSLPQQSPDLRP